MINIYVLYVVTYKQFILIKTSSFSRKLYKKK